MGRTIGVGDLAVSDFGQCSTIHIYVPITKKIRPLVIDLIAQRKKKQKTTYKCMSVLNRTKSPSEGTFS
jgi:tricorn protease-like protein